MKQIALLSFLLCVSFSSLFSQINIKTGYALSYVNPKANNDILNAFNESIDFLDNTFKETHWMHGLILGGRYKMDNLIAIELGFTTRFSNTDAFGIQDSTEIEVYRKLNYSYNSLSFGLESLVGRIGVGATIDYNLLRIKSKHVSDGNKKNALKGNNWSSTIYFSYNTESSNGISLSIRPFLQFPWTKILMRDLEEDFYDVPSTNSEKEGFLNFGLSLLFINGN